MNKEELQVKLKALQQLLDEQNTSANNYRNQIQELQKQLKDINKPKLTPLQFDKLHEAVEEGVGSFDFDDSDNYSFDFHIDYDNRIAIESMSFQNSHELVREIYSNLEEFFGVTEAPKNNQENQD